jgi:hypothetical protein
MAGFAIILVLYGAKGRLSLSLANSCHQLLSCIGLPSNIMKYERQKVATKVLNVIKKNVFTKKDSDV